MENLHNQRRSLFETNGNRSSFSGLTQNSPVLREYWRIHNFSEEDVATLLHTKQILYPPFFSVKGLAQDILELTNAEPDVPLNTFITLNSLKYNKFLQDRWNAFLGTASMKGILHSPEHLIGYQKEIQLLSKLPQQEEKVFRRFEDVFTNVDALRKKVIDMEDLEQKETILVLLDNVRAFYADYKAKVLNVCQIINQKKSEGKSIEKEYSDLSHLIEPKAIMFGELLPRGPGYRIPREMARHILSIDHDGSLLKHNPEIPANHRVSYLPYQEDSESKLNPRVYFKANGLSPLQPGNEAMLYSLYRLLNIPAPLTGLLVITGIHDNDPHFYTVQASEAVVGESPKDGISLQEELESDPNYLLSFCQQAVGAILTNPGDGKAANFIHHKEKYGLVSIDNDVIFSREFYISEKNLHASFETKTLLFCLKTMDKPIPRSLSTFLMTLDPQLLLLAWLDELDHKNQEYMYLESVLCYENARQNFQKILPYECLTIEDFLKKPITFYGLSRSFLESFALPITVSNNIFSSLQKKLCQIITALSDNLNSTPQELLDKTSSNLGGQYRKLRNTYSDPLEAIEVVWEENRRTADCSTKSSFLSGSCLTSSISEAQESVDQSHANLFSPLYESLQRYFMLDRFVEKYGERRKKRSLQPEEALRELWCLIRMRLTAFQDAQNVVDFWYKGRNEINDEMIIEQWDALFFLLQDPELKWLFTLEKYFPRGWKNTEGAYPKSISDVKGAFMGKCSLSKAVIEQILDNSGAFKEEVSLTGRSKVARFPNENPIFYFKKSPEIPGYEYAATLFMRSLGLEGVPYSELLLFWGSSEGVYSVLLTQAVQGVTLDKIWRDDNNFSLLDPHHTYLLILCSILINPEDGKGDNYILTPDKRRIIPIDNDHVFLPGTIQEERGFFSKTVYTELQSKTVLYCLHEMSKPIPSSVAQIFAKLDIDKFLDCWLKKLARVNENYQILPPEDHLIKAGDKGVFFRIALQMEYIKNLYTKFYRMKQLLSERSQITPFEILNYLEPYVAKLYMKAFQVEPTVLKRFTRLTENLYQTDKEGHQISRLNSLQIFKILSIPKSELVNQDFLRKLNPHNASEFLAECQKQLKQSESYYQRVVKGELELQTTELAYFSDEREKLILKVAFEKNRGTLALHNSKLLDGTFLSSIFDSPQLSSAAADIRLLDLRGAKRLNSFCILLISAHLPNLEYLNLGYHPLLTCAMFLDVNFRRMKRLALTNCPNLFGLIVESSLLDVLEINNNPSLNHVLLHTPHLTYFDFTANYRTQIHMFESMKKLQETKPNFTDMERIINKIASLEVIRAITDAIVDRIVQDITIEQCLVSERRIQDIKNEMPDKGVHIVMFGVWYYGILKASVKITSLMINDSYEMKVERLTPKVKKIINRMVNEAFADQVKGGTKEEVRTKVEEC